MEFNILDNSKWHTISLILSHFDAVPSDTVYAQLALMDWGLKKYHVDVDYFKMDIVNIDSILLDFGVQVSYHPPIENVETFSDHLPVWQDASVDINFTNMNFNNWCSKDCSRRTMPLKVSGSPFVIWKLGLRKYAGKKAKNSGLLELTTYSLKHSPEYSKDFGMIHVTEILGGNPNWKQENVTLENFCNDQPLDSVLNSQMILDFEVNENHNAKNFITISNPVLQRMIDGKTLEIAIRPLGTIVASFYSSENNNDSVKAKLHINFEHDLSSNE